MEQETLLLVKQRIFERNQTISGNVVFCNQVYDFFLERCNLRNVNKLKKRSVMSKMTKALAHFKIFIKSGPDLRRGNPFYFNVNQIIIWVVEAQLTKALTEANVVKELNDGVILLRTLAMQFRNWRHLFEGGNNGKQWHASGIGFTTSTPIQNDRYDVKH